MAPRSKREEVTSFDLKRETREIALAARTDSVSVPVYDDYIQSYTGNPTFAPGVTVTNMASSAVQFGYTAGEETTFEMAEDPNTWYLRPCCRPSTACWINPADGSYLNLAWTYVASHDGFYPGAAAGGESEEYCTNRESFLFSVDTSTGELSVQYLNPTDTPWYPVGYTIPPHEPETYIVLFNGYLYLTANPTLTAVKLGGGDLVTLYVNAQ